MARLEVDGGIYNVRKSRIRTRVQFPHIVRQVLALAGTTEEDASEELRLIARTFAFTMLDTEYVSGDKVLPLVDNTANLSGDVLLEAWEQFGNLDALTFVKDFWDAHTETNTPLNDPNLIPAAVTDIENEKKA